MIVLFTDFGPHGPYVGQVEAVLAREAPGVPVIDLINDAPVFDPGASAHLLSALRGEFPGDTVFLGVVDPGVGGPRAPIVARICDQWFVGPDNGLFNVCARGCPGAQRWDIGWRPSRLSPSFHGRDLFAPVTARLAIGEAVAMSPRPWSREELSASPLDHYAVIYIDGYGNAMTGIRASHLERCATLVIGGRRLPRANTFGDIPKGEAFWYENSLGLVEVSMNSASAAREMGLAIGARVEISDSPVRA